MGISEILAAMRDVDGVHGSFVVSRTGALAGKDLPAMFDDAVLAEVGHRIVRLHDGLCAGGEDFDQCVMRFADHKLYLRSVPNGFLCVLSTNGVNAPALKMALTLTSRRVDPLIVAQPPPPTPDPAPSAEPPRASVPPPAVLPTRKQATYRGHRV